MTKEDAAKVLAVKYELDYNTFRKSERFKNDLMVIRDRYFNSGDGEFDELFDRYVMELRNRKEMPRWARLMMAERYSINI